MLHASPGRGVAAPIRRRQRWIPAIGLAGALCLTLAAPLPVSAAEGDPLGPTLVETGEGPGGYAVQFRYDAPDDVDQVHIYGDWTYSTPEGVTCNDCGDGRMPWEWQPGDIAATPWRTIPMTLGSDGIWEVTVPLPAGSFRYAFTHDCASVTASGCTLYPDPENMWELQAPYPGAPGAVRSTTWVPQHPDFPTYETDYQRPVPADRLGTLEALRYPSPNSTNPPGVHDLVVYTPHGYDPDREVPYPTLYLSHGSGDHSTAWTMQGVAHYIVQNAIDEGAVQDMVIVSTDFNGLPGGNNGYANELRDHIIPFIEANYNVSTDPNDRAFAGFSAGGSRAFTIMYDHTDLFGYHAAWSSGGPAATPAQLERLFGVEGGIMIGTGLQDKLGNIAENSIARAAALRDAGADITEFNVPGVHTWHVWRPLLNFYIRELAFRSTDTAISVEATPSGLTATATVTPVTQNVAAVGGEATFTVGGVEVGTSPVVDGVAVFESAWTDALLAGAEIAVEYSGDSFYNGSASAGSPATPPVWDAGVRYEAGDAVTDGGAVWQALRPNRDKATGDAHGPWQEMAYTDEGDVLWTATRSFERGDVVVYDGARFEANRPSRGVEPGTGKNAWTAID